MPKNFHTTAQVHSSHTLAKHYSKFSKPGFNSTWTENFEKNLYAGQELIVRTGCETTNWFQIGKGVYQVCILSPCLFNFYAEYIMQNARLDEAQARIKIAGRNINNLRFADDTTLMVESEEELKNILMLMKEESEKAVLKNQHSEN